MNPVTGSRTLKILYLACPYTDPDHLVRQERFNLATRAAASLIAKGHIVFSPITMTHPIDIVMAGEWNTLGSDFWVRFDQAFMERCDEFVLLTIDGWQNSSGIQRELEYFSAAGKPLWKLSSDFNLSPLFDSKGDISKAAPLKKVPQ
jgi:nucleoside 2-deoxyribosyltransferase